MSMAVQTIEKDKVGLSVDVDPAEAYGSLSDDGEESDSTTEIKKPGPHDVLLGRGGGTNNHQGNVNFRQLVRQHKMRYLACSKVEKPKVAREVVQLWRKLDPPGRFLQRNNETKKGPGSVKDVCNIWVEVNEKKAREKASQCLRERTEDVLPYLSHLRQQQDQMTEQGVTQVQRHLKMEQSGNAAHNSPNAVAQGPGNCNSILNMPDRPADVNANIYRRGSLPVDGAAPVTPVHAGLHERRTSMPAASHMHSQQQQQLSMNMQMMARQQQVLRNAFTVIERSGGAQSAQNMVGMQQAMGQQQLLAERRALMHQQRSSFEGQMLPNGLTPQERMMMQNNLMAQQSQAMGRAGVSGMMDQGGQQQGMNMAMMANNNNNIASLNAGMHNRNMANHQVHQMHSPRAQQQRIVDHQLDHHRAAMSQLSLHGMNAQQSPHGMNPQSPHGIHPQSPHGQRNSNMAFHEFQHQQAAKNPLPVQRNGRPRTSPHPVRDIHVPVNVDDLEPLPAYGQEQERASTILLNVSPVPDTHKSVGPPRFISPNIVNETRQAESRDKLHADQDGARRSQNKRSNASKRLAAGGGTDEYDNSNPLPVDHRGDQGQGNNGDGGILGESNDGRGGDATLKEYRKTLEDYITNHQISTPAVDIDDDVSDEGGGFEGIDASAWIQQALHDSTDLSLNNRKNPPAGGRRGLMKEHRENSKKSLMSTGTGDAGSFMSIALSDMDESMPLRDHSARDAPTRGSFSNRSISSELTDFSELDCL
jgi:hypothetical protein